MIYIQTGLKTSKLKEIKINVSAFEWLEQYQPKKITGDIKQFKQARADYFISGYIEPDESGKLVRNNDNLIRRDLIIMDYDDLTSADDFKQAVHQSLKDYQYMLYTTISHTNEKPRYRLIIEPNRPILQHEYKTIQKEISSKIGLKTDDSATTWSQLQGLPVSAVEIVNKGEKYPIADNVPIDEPKKANSTLSPTIPSSITHEKAIEIMNKYVEADPENLQDYNNSLSAIAVIAKSVKEGTISYPTACECVSILAMGNADWEYENRKKLEDFLTNQDIRTQASFLDKFHKMVFNKPKTMAELYKILEMVGEQWRMDNTPINENGQVGKTPLMPPYTIANKLLKYHHFILIGNNKDDSPTYYYNFETGLYEHSETNISTLMRKLEYRSTPRHWQHAEAVIRQEAELYQPFNNKDIIPVNNGIYNIKTQQLLPFDPKYHITSKITTNYNPHAKSPKFFDVDNWLLSIACGDSEIVQLLWEFMNEAINPNHTRNKIGFLIGGGDNEGNNGKGTYQALLLNLIGKDNVATLTPDQFNERFKVSQLDGKICNIGDDISNAYIDDVKALMSIATGDPITIEKKHKSAYTFYSKPFCIFSGNDMPRVRNKSGWHRRAVVVPFNADFNTDGDPNIKDKYIKDKRVLEYVLKKVLAMKFDKFTIPKAVQREIEEYKKDNDYILTYIEDEYMAKEYHYLQRVPVGFVKRDIDEYFRREGIRQHLGRGVGKKVVGKLVKLTEKPYSVKKMKVTSDIKTNMPFEMLDYITDVPIYVILKEW